MDGSSSVDVIGNIYIIIIGSYCSNTNLDKFVNIGRLYNINRFYNIDIFNCNSNRRG